MPVEQGMSKRFSSGFGFKIDYKAAIEEDERNVRRYEAGGVVATTWKWLSMVDHDGWRRVVSALDVATMAGLKSKEMLQDFLGDLQQAGAGELASADVLGPVLFDDVPPEFLPEWDKELPFRPQLAKKTEDILLDIEVRTEDSRKECLAKAKASLARHRRNQAKNGA